MERESSKKVREAVALHLIYDPSECLSVPSECPDFVLYRGSTSLPFGVEITEMHYSQSTARLTHIPGYALDLMDGGPFRHKQDAATIKVDTVEFISLDGTRQSAKAVIQEIPPLDDYLSLLACAIETKTAKAQHFLRALSHVNLIIVDHANRIIGSKPEAVYSLLFREDVRDRVARAPFHEIYLITALEPPERVYIPMRMLLLVSSAFLFAGALGEFAADWPLDTFDDYIECLWDYLLDQGWPVRLHRPPDGTELILGNTRLQIGADGGIHLRTNSDMPVALERELLTRREGPWRSPAFQSAFAKYRQSHTFTSPFAFPVRMASRPDPAA